MDQEEAQTQKDKMLVLGGEYSTIPQKEGSTRKPGHFNPPVRPDPRHCVHSPHSSGILFVPDFASTGGLVN